MHELQKLGQVFGELGKSFVRLDFDTHPAWQGLAQKIQLDSATAIVDNTTLRNALLLMRDGIGGPDSFRAALLPDLWVLFFALTHFDALLLLAHDLTDDERGEIESLFGGIITTFIWKDQLAADRELQWDLYRKFNSIQTSFERQPGDLHVHWSSQWSQLFGCDDLCPQYFNSGKLDRLLTSPAQPLHWDLTELESGTCSPQIDETGLLARHLEPQEHRSTLASYHTFRSVFYYALSEHLQVPYLPCGIRGVATNTLPIASLERANDPLNPTLQMTLEQLATSKPFASWGASIEIPVLSVAPSLAQVFDKVRQFEEPNWQVIITELRSESFEYRRRFREFVEASAVEKFDHAELTKTLRALTSGGSFLREAASVVKITALLAAGYIAEEPAARVAAIAEAVQSRPWEFMKLWAERRRIKFILNSRDLAACAGGLERECLTTWGRGFSSEERAYLSRLENTNALYGV